MKKGWKIIAVQIGYEEIWFISLLVDSLNREQLQPRRLGQN